MAGWMFGVLEAYEGCSARASVATNTLSLRIDILVCNAHNIKQALYQNKKKGLAREN